MLYLCSSFYLCQWRKGRKHGVVLVAIIFIVFSLTSIPKYPSWSSTVHHYEEVKSISERSHSPQCEAVQHLMFLKTHKCASTTLQNIILRYGHRNNLTFVLPPSGNNLGNFDQFEPFHADLALPLPSTFGNEYQIFAHHARFMENNIAEIMPRDTVYITIIREPVEMYESIWYYFQLDLRYNVSLPEFARNPVQYYFNAAGQHTKKFGWNPLMSDLGLEETDFTNQSTIEKAIKKISNKFSLIMISGRMEESLILLRSLLCWDFQDVVAFHLNSQPKSYYTKLTEIDRQNIRAWNKADNLLYHYFLAKFEKQVSEYGSDKMGKDVIKLRDLMQKWKRRCSPKLFPTLSRKDKDYCHLLCVNELEFTNIVRSRLWPNYGFRSRYRGKGHRLEMDDINLCDEIML